MTLSPSMLKVALLDAQQCNGIAPTTSQMLIEKGWAEWVDHEFGTPIDENSPRSLMRLTDAGHAQLAGLQDARIEQVIVTKPAVTLAAAPSPQSNVVPIGYPVRVRARVAA